MRVENIVNNFKKKIRINNVEGDPAEYLPFHETT